jgi:sugar O-acyltransferase (sialic acid O-acetyltransferase NeuD family)
MSSLLVLGAGGHGKVVADAAMSMGRWDAIAFLDDYQPSGAGPLRLEIVGRLEELEQIGRRFNMVAAALGSNHARLELYQRCSSAELTLATIVHPAATVSAHASLGAGCVVIAQAVVNPGATLGVACIVNSGATVDHDCLLGDAVHVSPGANLAGNVRVGARAWIGIGACVRQGLTIGDDAIVGAGGVVVEDVMARTTVFGVPARVHK